MALVIRKFSLLHYSNDNKYNITLRYKILINEYSRLRYIIKILNDIIILNEYFKIFIFYNYLIKIILIF